MKPERNQKFMNLSILLNFKSNTGESSTTSKNTGRLSQPTKNSITWESIQGGISSKRISSQWTTIMSTFWKKDKNHFVGAQIVNAIFFDLLNIVNKINFIFSRRGSWTSCRQATDWDCRKVYEFIFLIFGDLLLEIRSQQNQQSQGRNRLKRSFEASSFSSLNRRVCCLCYWKWAW